MNIQEKVGLVTGARSGVGRAKHFAYPNAAAMPW